MYPTQSNTRPGAIPATAGEDLSASAGRLAVLTKDAGATVAKLPSAATDKPAYLLVDGDTQGNTVALMPLGADHNRRIRLKGICALGDTLVMADPTVAADRGKVITQPATGQHVAVGIAEEDGVDGQLVLVRPYLLGLRVGTAG